MATLVARPSNPTKASIGVPGSRYDHFFFSTMAVVMLATVFVGFAHTYYLAGVFHAPLPSLIIHLHGAAFSCWILLLVAQTSFVSTGRVDIHRMLGIAGFLLACLMVALGVLAATDSLRRGTGPTGLDAQLFYVIPMTDMLSRPDRGCRATGHGATSLGLDARGTLFEPARQLLPAGSVSDDFRWDLGSTQRER